jgi:hypothetical protein
MSEMVDRVAKALCAAKKYPPEIWEAFQPEARTAILAMREPTREILSAMWRRNDDNDSAEATLENWQEAIDAALGKVDA